MYPITSINNQRMNIQIIVIKKFHQIDRHCVDINDLDKASSTRRIHNLIWVIWVKRAAIYSNKSKTLKHINDE
ncbi:uncharacterized protein OCT59_020100 [Rhizophagus irregularis]|uniref:uncharacterized protein n=1 Tax=Rhizophagus irregularis TaxID=588596 RepID=UPI003322CCB8|nr:hypothetical protein OCT59_020100 [Rhizophagus irregularis]